MNLEIIRNLCESREGGLKKLAADIGMSEANLHRCIRNNKIQASDLEKISELLQTDIKFFYQADDNSITQSGDQSGASINGDVTINAAPPSADTAKFEERIAALEQILKEKDNLVAEKERVISEKQNLVDEKERLIRILLARQNS